MTRLRLTASPRQAEDRKDSYSLLVIGYWEIGRGQTLEFGIWIADFGFEGKRPPLSKPNLKASSA